MCPRVGRVWRVWPRLICAFAEREGHDIFTAVDTASRTVLDAQTKIDACVTAAAGQGGQPARVDYQSIEQLRALEVPLQAGAFALAALGYAAAKEVPDFLQSRTWANARDCAQDALFVTAGAALAVAISGAHDRLFFVALAAAAIGLWLGVSARLKPPA